MVLYPGHPLVGHMVPVVRRYGQRERGQWIIELPDGSRQYIPISWCAPLSSSEETLPLPMSSQDGPPSKDPTPSPLSVEALRNLAALVRRLQEKAAQRGEEQHDARPGACDDASDEPAIGREDETDGANLGELPAGGSAPTGAGDPAGGTPPGGDAVAPEPADEVSES